VKSNIECTSRSSAPVVEAAVFGKSAVVRTASSGEKNDAFGAASSGAVSVVSEPRRPLFEATQSLSLDPRLRSSSPGGFTPRKEAEENERRSRRRERNKLRSFLWKNSTLRSIRGCGRSLIGSNAGLRLSKTNVASFSGTVLCSSHACPCCASRIMNARRQQVEAAIKEWVSRGGKLYLLTLTMRHSASSDLAELWDGLSSGFGAVSSGKRWTEEKIRYGLVGSIRAVELMVTPKGKNFDPHLHQHILLFVDPSTSEVQHTDQNMKVWEGEIFKRYSRALARKGIECLPIGQDLREISFDPKSLAAYLNKAFDTGEKLGFEMANGSGKTGKSSLTPFQLLRQAMAGDIPSLKYWQAFEKIQKGRRRLLWSYRLREFLGLEDELSDDELEDVEEGTTSVADTVLVFEKPAWKKLVSLPQQVTEVLDLLEQRGLSAVQERLRAWGIDWVLPPPLPRPEASPG